LILFKMEIR